MAISRHAQDTWKRFASWYGGDALERKFGLTVPPDWAETIDGIDRNQLPLVLAEMKQKFPTWLPGLPEFEVLVRQLAKPKAPQGPSMQEQLIEYAIKNYALTGNQLRMPWRYLHTGNRFNGEAFAVTGVEIPADGETSGYRIIAVDMQAA